VLINRFGDFGALFSEIALRSRETYRVKGGVSRG
jgi:hypothetical protein